MLEIPQFEIPSSSHQSEQNNQITHDETTFEINPNGQVLVPSKKSDNRQLILNLSNSKNLQIKDPMKLIIKVGSNTIKAFFTDLVRDLHEESNVTNLGDIDTYRVSEESTYRLKEDKKDFAIDVFKRIAEYAKEFNVTDIEFLATESIRKTTNGRDLLEAGKQIFNNAFQDSVPINIHLVTEKEEAEFAKEAVRYERGEQSLSGKNPNLIIDLGGSSGEIIKVSENQVEDIANDPEKEVVSLKLGSHQIINKLDELKDFDPTYQFIETEFDKHVNISNIKNPETTLNLIGGRIREIAEKLTDSEDLINTYKPDAYDLYQGISKREKELKGKLEGKLGNLRIDEKSEDKAKSLSAVFFMKVLLEKVYGKENLTSASKDEKIFKNEKIHFLTAGMIQGYQHKRRKELNINNPFEGAVLPIRSINARTLKIGEQISDWVKEKAQQVFNQFKEKDIDLPAAKNEMSRELKNKAIEVAAPLSAIFRINNNLSSLKVINKQLKAMLDSVNFGFDTKTNNRLKTFARKLLLVNFSGKLKELGELPGNEFKNFIKLKNINDLQGDDSAASRIGQLMRLGNLISPMNPQALKGIDVNLVEPLTRSKDAKNDGNLEIFVNSTGKEDNPLMLGDKIKKALRRLNHAFINTMKNLSSPELVKTVNS